MAEHEVTEAMVEAALLAAFGDSQSFDDEDRSLMQAAISAALAAHTTPQPTDASAASGAVNLCALEDVYDLAYHHSYTELGRDASTSCRDALRAVLSAARTHPTGAGADADWVLVPREPTDEMLVAGQEAWAKARHKIPKSAIEDCDEANAVYKAMLASSPQQRAGDGG